MSTVPRVRSGVLLLAASGLVTYSPAVLPQSSPSTATTWSVLLTEMHSAKAAARVATTGNVALSGAPSAVDGVSLYVGDRVLVMNQTNPAQNGIYIVDTVGDGNNGIWLRASDADMWVKLVGATLYVTEGATHGGAQFRSTAVLGGVLDATSATFIKTASKINESLAGLATNGILVKDASGTAYARTLTSGNGIALTNPDGIGGDPTIAISTSYTGQESITTLGAITSGTWNATTVAPAYGGTGISSYTTGDILFAGGASTLSKLGIGSAGTFLVSDGSQPTWQSIQQAIGYTPANIAGGAFLGSVGVVPGSAAAAGLYINGSFGTGVFSPAPNQISLTANSAETLRVSASGADIRQGGLLINGVQAIDTNRAASFTTLSATGAATVGGLLSANGGIQATSLTVTGTTNFTGLLLATGDLSLKSGSAVAPSLRFSSSTSTGLFWGGADVLGVATAGVERLRVDAAGNIGIGTTNPAAQLHVAGDIKVEGYTYLRGGEAAQSGNTHFPYTDGKNYIRGDTFIADNGGVVVIGASNSPSSLTLTGTAAMSGNVSGGAFVPTGTVMPVNGMYLSDTNALAFSTNNTQRMVIDSAGNVGLGVAAPSAKLNVSGTAGSTLTKWQYGARGMEIRAPGSTWYGVNYPHWLFGTNDAFAFMVDNVTGMYMSTYGNIGIGTMSPSAALDVSGTARFTSNTTIGGALAVTGLITANAGLRATTGNFTGAVSGTAFIPTGTTMPVNGMYLSSTNALAFATNNTQRMVIDSTGKVAFGTATPISGFQVNGGGLSSSGEMRLHNPNNANTGYGYSLVFSNEHNGGLKNLGQIAALRTKSIEHYGADLVFYSANTGGVLNEGMRILTTGNVGIGTTAPGARLDVSGTANFTSNTTIGGTLAVTGLITANAGLSATSGNFTSTVSGTAFVPTGTVMPVNGMYLSDTNALAFSTSNTQRMVIDSTGKVAFGTATPISGFQVNGGALSSSGEMRLHNPNNADTGYGYSLVFSNEHNAGLRNLGQIAALRTANATHYGADLVFYSANTQGVLNEGMRILTTGDVRLGNKNLYSMSRTLPTAVGDAVDIGTFTLSGGAASLHISVVVASSNFSITKHYVLPVGWNLGTAAWTTAQPIADSGTYMDQDFELDISVSGGTPSLRLRRTMGTRAGTAYISIQQDGLNTNPFTASTAVSTPAAPTSFYQGTALRQVSGNVGIGLAAPSAKLDVSGTANFTSNTTIGGTLAVTGLITANAGLSATSGNFTGAVSGTAFVPTGTVMPVNGMYLSDTNALAFATSNTQRMVIDSTGKVGIGTVNPTATLTVAGDINLTSAGAKLTTAADQLVLEQTGAAAGATRLTFQTTPVNGAVLEHAGFSLVDLGLKTSGGNLGVLRLEQRSAYFVNTGNSSGEFQWVDSQATGNSRKLIAIGRNATIIASTMVGIGTTTPNRTLDVSGTANFTSNTTIGGTLAVTGLITANAGLSATSGNFTSTVSGTAFVPTGTTMPVNGMYLSDTNALAFSTSNTQRMVIDSNGKVGIGTATPAAQLHVSGNVQIDTTLNGATQGSALTVQGSWMQLGDLNGTFSATGGIGLKFADSGNVHWSAGIAPGRHTFLISNTSNNGGALFPTGRFDAFAITNAGNVGIGNTNPSTTLDVSGTANFTSNTTIGGTLAVTGVLTASSGLTATTGNFTGAVSGTAFIPTGTTMPVNGMYLSSTNALAFSTSNTQRMVIDSSGNLGLGTSTPGYLLDVAGNTNLSGNLTLGGGFTGDGIPRVNVGNITDSDNRIQVNSKQFGIAEVRVHNFAFAYFGMMSNNSGGSRFGVPTGTVGFGAQRNQPIVFANDSIERMRIGSSGNVGIGTTAPSAALDIRPRNGGSNMIRIRGTFDTDGSPGDLMFSVDQSNWNYPTAIIDTARANAGYTALSLRAMGTEAISYNGQLVFSTSATQRMVINSAGLVGIGTINPGATLDVSGTANITSNTTIGGTLGVTELLTASAGLTIPGAAGQILKGTTDGSIYDFNSSGDVSSYYPMIITGGGGASNYGSAFGNYNTGTGMGFWRTNSAGKRIRFGYIAGEATATAGAESGDLIFSTMNSGAIAERVRMTGGGNLGIGTSNPSAKLDVAGTANFASNTTIGGTLGVTGLITASGGLSTTTLNIGANTIVLGGNFTTSGANALTLTTTGPTNVTLPVTGTLATLDGSETFTNKTLTSPTINGGTINNVVIGGTTPAAGTFTTLTANGLLTANAGVSATSTSTNYLQIGTGADKFSVTTASAVGGLDYNAKLLGNGLELDPTTGQLISSPGSAGNHLRSGVVLDGRSLRFMTYQSTSSATTQYLAANDITRMIINEVGRVGIGTTAPANVLDVSGTARFTGNTSVGGTLTAVGTISGAAFNATGFSAPSNGMYLSDTNALAFSTAGGQRMVIDSVGRVGVGTSTPSVKFEVFGGGGVVHRASGLAGAALIGAFADDYYSAPTYRGTYLSYRGVSDTNTSFGLPNARRGDLIFQNNSIGLIGTNGAPLVFATVDSEKMRITAAGRVGIGMTNPSTVLDVSGTARFTSNTTVGGTLGVTDLITASSGLSATSAVFTTLSAAVVPLIAKGGSGQTVNLFEVQNSAGTAIFNVSPASGGTLRTGSGQAGNGFRLLSDDGGNIAFYPNLTQHSYNDAVGPNDAALIFSRGSINTGGFVLAPHGGLGNVGLRMTNTGSVSLGLLPTENIGSYKFYVVGDTYTSGAAVLGGGLTANGGLSATSGNFTGAVSGTAFIPTGTTMPVNGMYLSSANALAFATNSGQRMVIDSSGNVGINLTAPQSKFHVFHDANAADRTLLQSSNPGYFSPLNLWNSDTGSNAGTGILFSAGSAPTGYTGGLFSQKSGANGLVALRVVTNGALYDEAMVVTGSAGGPSVSIKGVSGQSADLFVVKNNSNANLFQVDSAGALTAAGLITASAGLSATSGNFTSTVSGSAFVPTGTTMPVNGMYLSSTNALAFSTNNTRRMVIDSTGNVGIGTATPGYVLDVSGTANFFGNHSTVLQSWSYRSGDGSVRALSLTAPTMDGVTLHSDIPFVFATNNAFRFTVDQIAALTIDPYGAVGIGTTQPTKLLDVAGTARFRGVTTIDGTLGVTGLLTASAGVSATSGNFTGTVSGTAFIPTGTTMPTNGMYLSSANALAFATNSGQRMVIDSTGKVGIGTSTPAQPLDVNGAIAVGGTSVINADRTLVMRGNFRKGVVANFNDVIGDAFGMEQVSAAQSGSVPLTRLFTANVLNAGIAFGKYTDSTAFTDWMRIDSAGRVGIGNASPSAMLDVAGTANFTSNTTIGGTLAVTGLITANAGLSATSGNFTGPVTVTGNLTAPTFIGALSGTAVNATNLGGFGLNDSAVPNGTSAKFVPRLFVNQAADYTVRYYKIGTVIANNGNFRIKGAIAGHQVATSEGSGAVDITVHNRGGTTPVVGAVTGSLGSQDLLVFRESDNSLSIYLKTAAWALVDIEYSGSAGATAFYSPAASTDAPTGTQLFSASAQSTAMNAYALVTAGVNRMTVNSIGNVGIGTTSPTSTLTVAGDISLTSAGSKLSTPASELVLEQTGDTFGTTRLRLQNRNGAGGAIFENTGLALVDFGFKTSTGNQAALRFEQRSGYLVNSGNTTGEMQWIDSSTGNYRRLIGIGRNATIIASTMVGIGNASPSAMLDVAGTANFTSNTTIGGTLAVTGLITANAGLSATTGNFTGAVSGTAFIPTGTTMPVNGMYLSDTNALAFSTNNTMRLVIDSIGEVGIGTNNPTNMLDVSGTARFTGNTTVGGTLGVTGLITANAGLSATSGNFTGAVSGSAFIPTGTVMPVNGMYLSSTNALAFSTNTQQRMVIDASGRVGVGIASPTYRLDVSGTARFSDTIRTTKAWDPTFGAGSLYLAGTDGNRIDFASQGADLPTLTTRSSGTKIVLYPALTDTRADYAMGVGAFTMWQSIPDALASNSFRFYGADTELLRIRGDGNVGIGTTNPSYKLDVAGTGRFTDAVTITKALGVNTGAGGLYLNGVDGNRIDFNTQGVAFPTLTTRSSGTKIVLYPALNDTRTDFAIGVGDATLWQSIPNASAVSSFRFYGADTELLRIRGDGNVGIGTTSPAAKLDVAGDVRFTSNATVGGTLAVTGGAATITDSGNSGTARTLLTLKTTESTTTTAARLDFAQASAVVGRIGSESENNAQMGMRFSTYNSGLYERLRITAAGNVGIGVTNPSAKLDVAGSAKLTGSLQVGNGADANGAGTRSQFALQFFQGGYSHLIASRHNSVANDGNAMLFYLNTSNVSSGSTAPGTGNALSYFMGYQSHQWRTLDVERMRVDSSGNVGIGTSSPGATLDVSGTANFTGNVSGGAFIPTGTTMPVNGMYLSDTNALAFATNSGQRMVIDSSGKVGIGTANPGATFDVSGTARFTGNVTMGSRLTVQGTSATTGVMNDVTTLNRYGLYVSTVSPNGQASGGIAFGEATGSGVQSSIIAYDDGSAAATGLRFYTGYSGGLGVSVLGLALQINSSQSVAFYGTANAFAGLSATSVTASGNVSGGAFIPTGTVMPVNGMYLSDTNALAFATSNTQRMVIDSSGNVGIGVTSPSAKLDVVGNSNNTAVIRVGTGGSGTAGAIWLGNAAHGLARGPSGYSTNDIKLFTAGTGATSGNLIFATNFLDRMRITVDGNVGIGTATPGSMLDVAGTANFTSNTTIGGTLGVTGLLTASAGVSATSGNFTSTVSGSAFVPTGTVMPVNGMYLSSTNALAFATNSGQRMVIDSAGNLGIGTTSPSGKLHVDGTAYLQGLTNSNTGYALCLDSTTNELIRSSTGCPNSSDMRFKQNIEPITNGLAIIEAMNPVRYDWNRAAFPNRGFDDRRQVGVLAQQLEPLVPEVVYTDAAGYKSVNYAMLTSVLAAGIKELSNKVTQQGNLITNARDRVKTIEDWIGKTDPRLKALEDFMGRADTRLATVEKLAAKTEGRVQSLESWKTTTDTRLASADEMIQALSDTSRKHTTLLAYFVKTDDKLRVDVPNFQVSNFSAELAEIAVLKAQKFEAEQARIKQLEAEKIKAKELEAQQVKGNRMLSGEKDVFVSMGETVPIFDVPTGSHFVINASSDDGSYASATAISAGGNINITPAAAKGIDIVANGQTVSVVAAGKKVSVSWLRTK